MQGKVVLITGASQGIGRFIAQTFAETGASLALADLKPLDTTAGILKGMGQDPLLAKADVGDEADVQRMVSAVLDRYGHIDVLVNNAGIATHAAWEKHWPRIRDMDKTFFDRVMNTNLGGTMLCSKHVIPSMEERRSGHILNLHGGGRPEQFGGAVYVTSKDAIKTFTKYIAEEEREFGICIMAVTPGGAIATEDAPASVKAEMPGVESVANRFVLAAQAPMEMSGKTVTLREGQLVVA
jgi:NAD(P)-dependent dehydrogenase (short-subunit alcohol dehydrogenase family)